MNQEQLIKCNLKPLRIDSMPAEVATEYLIDPLRKSSGSFRRACAQARYSYYVSTNEPKPAALKLARRFSRLPIDRLLRQLRRTEQRVKSVQNRLTRITVEHYKAQVVNSVMLPLLAEGKAILAELHRREDNMAAVAQAKDVSNA